MVFDFDPLKDLTNHAKHGVGLAHGARVFDDPDRLIVPTLRVEDEEDRFKAIGAIDGPLWRVVHVYRGERIRLISVRRSNVGEAGLHRSD